MNITSGHLKAIVSSAVDVLDVIKDIWRAYLTDSPADVLYDTTELDKLVRLVMRNNASEMDAQFKNAGELYFTSALPLRPKIVELFHARTIYILAFKKHTDLQDNRIHISGQLFMNALIQAVNANSNSIDSINADNLDDYFVEIDAVFRMKFIAALKAPCHHVVLQSGVAPTSNPTGLDDPEAKRKTTASKIAQPTIETTDSDDESVEDITDKIQFRTTPVFHWRSNTPSTGLNGTPCLFGRQSDSLINVSASTDDDHFRPREGGDPSLK